MNVSSAIKKRVQLNDKFNEVTIRMFGYRTTWTSDGRKVRLEQKPRNEFDKDYSHLNMIELNRERVNLCSEMNKLATLEVINEEYKKKYGKGN